MPTRWTLPKRSVISVIFGVAIHLAVAAKRYRAQLPARPGAVVPAKDLGAEADREDLDAHAIAARDQVMPELVHEDQHGEDDKKWDDVAQSAGKDAHEFNPSP